MESPAERERRKRNPHIGDHRWNELSKRIRRERPWCEACGASADSGVRLEVDHIIEVGDGGAIYEESNLEVLCRMCHARKTANVAWHREHMGSGSA